ncbi:cation diffusion facilitator family transporter [Aliiglaciecola litoralis]|uniref:Cation diffusion facilitator family transporter n=1 Tax=Aliiglaciecola litoralis TaxID=582857 RepID=A0ABP3X5L7_9ALTE
MQVKTVLLIEGCVNLLIALCKLSVGFMTNSTAIIADGVHSFTDVTNNIVAWMAVTISETPADRGHPYGHQKFEQLAIFVLATLLVVVAFEISLSAFQRIGEPVEHSFLGLIILIAALIINTILTLWERHWAKRLNSDILVADATHTLSDVLTSIAVIVGWQLASRGYYWIDAVFAIIISSIIFYLAFKLFQSAIPILVDSSEVDAHKMTDAIMNIDAVKEVRRVRSRSSGKYRIADVVVTVDPNMSTADSHQVADSIEHLLATKFHIEDAVVHIEPFEK